MRLFVKNIMFRRQPLVNNRTQKYRVFFVVVGIAIAGFFSCISWLFSSESALPVWRLSGTTEALYRLEWLPQLRAGVSYGMFSSYDRSGGNDDGFRGTYSKLRLEDGNSVIAEMKGAGCITRIWFTHSELRKNGLLALQGEHIKIYLNGDLKPVVDIPLEKLFSGELERFPKPLVGEGLGGFYCYIPIAYKDGCKVVIEGDNVRFYQITYSFFPDARGIEQFSMDVDLKTEKYLSKAVRFWSNPGDEKLLELSETIEISEALDLEENETSHISLPEGPHQVRAILLEGDVKNLSNALSAVLQLNWEGESVPAVDIVASYLFGQAFHPDLFKSLLAGTKPGQYYVFFPMPYRKNADLKVTASIPFSCRIRIIVEKLNSRNMPLAYFHVFYQQKVPTINGKYYTLVQTNGFGHYIGTYLVTEMERPQPLPEWLEGDERFFVNDTLVGHGTGTEDYFNCGWYAVQGRLNQPGAMPIHGFPVFRGNEQEGFTQATAYRWHLTDVIPFAGDLRVDLEHGPANDITADYRSCTFLYMKSPIH